MVPEVVPAAAQVVILGGGVLVGRALELLLRSANCNVRFMGEPSLGESGLGELGMLEGVRLLILASGASAGYREDVLALVGATTAEARIEVLELAELAADDRQEALVGARYVLPWPCRTEDLKRRVIATLLDGPGASQGDRGLRGPQKVREMLGGKDLN